MNRRGFLSALVLAPVAPAIVRAESLMRIIPKKTGVIVGELGRYDVIEIIETYSRNISIESDYTDLWGRGIVARDVHVRAQQSLNDRTAVALTMMLNHKLSTVCARIMEENRRILSKGSSPRHPGAWMLLDGDHHGEEKGRRQEVLKPLRPDGPQDRPAGPLPHRR